jgi:hypothetical protein
LLALIITSHASAAAPSHDLKYILFYITLSHFDHYLGSSDQQATKVVPCHTIRAITQRPRLHYLRTLLAACKRAGALHTHDKLPNLRHPLYFIAGVSTLLQPRTLVELRTTTGAVRLLLDLHQLQFYVLLTYKSQPRVGKSVSGPVKAR